MSDNNKIYAFFVSYRHAKDNPAADKFIRKFVAVLKTQVSLYLPGVNIFFDEERMRAGKDMSILAHSLCRSATMVMIYSPLYFDVNHTWCAREYKAMQELEKSRTKHVRKQDRFIIPVIFRGGNTMPGEIKDSIFCEDFDHILKECEFEKKECLKRIRAIADEIFQRYEALYNANIFTQENCNCDKFDFPSDAEIEQWLQKIAPLKNPPKYPGY